ncbi:MAG: hypothetical protein EOP07_08745 [Proteobacteria bacterium]|nr:MAG: hypothetical protein EOP07_08745 [Pseudomonadota bacterium]
MMRNTLGFFSLALLSACGGSTSTTNNGPVQTATIDKLEQYEDFLPSYSSDGSKAVFISQRDAAAAVEPAPTILPRLAHVYLYDASLADGTLKRYDDRLGLVPTEGKEFLTSLSTSGTWISLSRVTIATGANQLIVGHFSGSSKTSIDLAAGHSINELGFAKGSDDYLVYVDRQSETKTVKVLKVSGDETAVTLEEVGSFPNQDHPLLNFIDGKLQLVSAATGMSLSSALTVQTMDPAAPGVWTVSSDGTLAQSQFSSLFVSKAGLITKQALTTSRSRKKNGSSVVQTTAAAELSLILEEAKQVDLFQSALTYNFNADSYLAVEPLAISNISGTLDGQILLISSLDSFACTAAPLQMPTQKLVRQSDSKVITFTIGKKTTETAWNEIITNPCGVVDNSIDGVSRQLDATASRAELVGMDGDYALVSIESLVRGDRELRLARFKMDWDAGTVSDVTITDVSANPRP